MLIVPEWESTPYWIALKENKSFQQAVKRVLRFRTELPVFNRAESVLSRCRDTRMVAYKLKSGRKGTKK
jgi:hypothetical protein